VAAPTGTLNRAKPPGYRTYGKNFQEKSELVRGPQPSPKETIMEKKSCEKDYFLRYFCATMPSGKRGDLANRIVSELITASFED
jgi:hypothetical protein